MPSLTSVCVEPPAVLLLCSGCGPFVFCPQPTGQTGMETPAHTHVHTHKHTYQLMSLALDLLLWFYPENLDALLVPDFLSAPSASCSLATRYAHRTVRLDLGVTLKAVQSAWVSEL